MILDGKTVAVTGGGRGIGRAMALAFAAKGAAVIVNDPGVSQAGEGGDSAPAEEVVREIAAAGGRAYANHASVADPAGAQSIIDVRSPGSRGSMLSSTPPAYCATRSGTSSASRTGGR